MKTKIIYSLVCGNSDTYLEQLMVSAYSVRKYNPNAEIAVLIDKKTEEILSDRGSELKEIVSEIISIDTPFPEDKMRSSRYLKTNLRRFVKGDYLFIDCDTIVCESLGDIDNVSFELGMVADLNGPLLLTEKNVLEKCKKAGFEDVEGKPYFNSGVIYAKDTPNVHQFYEEWYHQWQYSDTNGVPYDQPALCQANINMGYMVKELCGKWNCQFKFFGKSFLNTAMILHYYSNTEYDHPSYSQQHIFEYVREKKCIDSNVKKMIKNPRTIFYTVMTVTSDKAFEYFNSEMIHYFFNVPPAYKIALKVAKFVEIPVLLLSKIKGKWK